jgi:hypothetical protein
MRSHLNRKRWAWWHTPVIPVTVVAPASSMRIEVQAKNRKSSASQPQSSEFKSQYQTHTKNYKQLIRIIENLRKSLKLFCSFLTLSNIIKSTDYSGIDLVNKKIKFTLDTWILKCPKA